VDKITPNIPPVEGASQYAENTDPLISTQTGWAFEGQPFPSHF